MINLIVCSVQTIFSVGFPKCLFDLIVSSQPLTSMEGLSFNLLLHVSLKFLMASWSSRASLLFKSACICTASLSLLSRVQLLWLCSKFFKQSTSLIGKFSMFQECSTKCHSSLGTKAIFNQRSHRHNRLLSTPFGHILMPKRLNAWGLEAKKLSNHWFRSSSLGNVLNFRALLEDRNRWKTECTRSRLYNAWVGTYQA